MPDTVLVFGNADLDADSLPLRILPELRARLKDRRFETKDPNEEWEVPEELTVIDTVIDLDQPRVFTDLKAFVDAPRVSMHDFDAFANLRLLQKIGRLKRVRIIGLPPNMAKKEATKTVIKLLQNP